MANTTNFNWETPDDTDLVKDGAAAIRTLGSSIDTSFVDLKGGTTGQILSKASNTDLDYTWITNDVGDITNVGVTAPITGGGSSGSVTIAIDDATTSQKGAVQLEDSTSSTSTTKAATPNSVKSAYDLANAAIPKSLVDAAGDLIYATADNTVARLAIGTAGKVLTVNSGATAPEWATLSSGGMTLLSTTTLSGSSVTVSSISTDYTDLKFILRGAYASGDADLFIRLNGDTDSDYSHYSIQIADATASGFYTDSATSVQIGFITSTNTYDKRTSFSIDLPRYNDTSNMWGVSTLSTNAFSARRQVQNFFRYNNSAAITSFTLFPASGTFSGGSLYIYGVK